MDFQQENIFSELVPKKGLEPPHPCEYMDLNHARLPIPPLRHDRIQRDCLDRQQRLVYKSRGRCQTMTAPSPENSEDSNGLEALAQQSLPVARGDSDRVRPWFQ